MEFAAPPDERLKRPVGGAGADFRGRSFVRCQLSASWADIELRCSEKLIVIRSHDERDPALPDRLRVAHPLCRGAYDWIPHVQAAHRGGPCGQPGVEPDLLSPRHRGVL